MGTVKIQSEEKIKELQKELKKTKLELANAKSKITKMVQNGESSYLNSSTYHQMQEYIDFLQNNNNAYVESIKRIGTKTKITEEEWNQLHMENQEFCQKNMDADYWIGIADHLYDAKEKKKLNDKIIALESQVDVNNKMIEVRNQEIERLQKLVGELKEATVSPLPVPVNFDSEIEAYKETIEQIKEIEHRVEILRAERKERMKKDGRGRPRVISDDKIALILNLREQGCSMREISDQVGVSLANVHKYIKQGQTN